MKKITTLCFCAAMTLTMQAQNFNDYFENKTLRTDYIFTGDAQKQEVYLDELSSLPEWAGRRHSISCHAADAIATHLGVRAIGVEHIHTIHPILIPYHKQQTIATDTRRPVARHTRKGRPIDTLQLRPRGNIYKNKIVTRAVTFYNFETRHTSIIYTYNVQSYTFFLPSQNSWRQIATFSQRLLLM